MKKHHRRAELVSFYERQNRHTEALQLITHTESMASDDTILNYLSKLDNDQLPLIFEHVRPMIKTALEAERDDDRLKDILVLFVGEPIPTSPSMMEMPGQRVIKLDPAAIFDFLKSFDEDFAVKYLEEICLKADLGPKQREIHNRLVFAYCDRLKYLSKELKRSLKDRQPGTFFLFKMIDLILLVR